MHAIIDGGVASRVSVSGAKNSATRILAASLISDETVVLRNFHRRCAGVPMHANFIVNRGQATSDEVLALIATIRQSVFNRTGYKMDCEARHMTAEGEERPAHEFTDAGRFDQSLLEKVKRMPA